MTVGQSPPDALGRATSDQRGLRSRARRGFALLLVPGHGFSASSVNYGVGVPKDTYSESSCGRLPDHRQLLRQAPVQPGDCPEARPGADGARGGSRRQGVPRRRRPRQQRSASSYSASRPTTRRGGTGACKANSSSSATRSPPPRCGRSCTMPGSAPRPAAPARHGSSPHLPGPRHPRHRFRPRGHRATAAPLRPDRHRARHPPRPPGRHHRAPRRRLDGTSSPQLPDGHGPARGFSQVPDQGPCGPVHQFLRRRVHRGRHQDPGQPAAGAQSERDLRKDDRHPAPGAPGPDTDRQ